MTSAKTVSPVDGRVIAEREHAPEPEIEAALHHASRAQREWCRTPIDERARILTRFVDNIVGLQEEISEELALQMGRPVGAAPGEVAGFEERARYMIDIAAETLADIEPTEKPGFTRRIRREPLGVVLTAAAWNYPYMIAVNSVVPALMAGNAVILKHSAQTPLTAERFGETLRAAGLPDGVFQKLHLSHDDTDRVIRDSRIDFVAFTGSVEGGHAIQRAASQQFIGTGLELGGKDPAYVRPDADLDHAVAGLVDGSFFNTGQSCCGIERIYAHKDVYNAFVERFVAETRQYTLGNPLDTRTDLGPMVRAKAADGVRAQIQEAVSKGARCLIDESEFPASKPGTPYLAPQILVDVTHLMSVMRNETFGPAVGIACVQSDEEAIAAMNDSLFGLTASVWTSDQEAALRIGDAVETGTFYMNRCDYLDPALAWVGVKDSGRGCTLSRVGYEQFTRPKSFHLRIST